MSASDRIEIARETYRAYELGDRSLVERHLAPEFRFSSPADVDIDLPVYFERCWPNAERIAGFEFQRIIESGDEVVVTYEATTTDGQRFRNTEVLTFAGDQIIRRGCGHTAAPGHLGDGDQISHGPRKARPALDFKLT